MLAIGLDLHQKQTAVAALDMDTGEVRQSKVSTEKLVEYLQGLGDEEKRVVTRMKLMRRNKKGGFRGMTYQQIAETLNAEGIDTRLVALPLDEKHLAARRLWNLQSRIRNRLPCHPDRAQRAEGSRRCRLPACPNPCSFSRLCGLA